jgi:2,4-dienoyl-CoA reductase-like NADH-dependent reductase (Old Yellow Enzyme family)
MGIDWSESRLTRAGNAQVDERHLATPHDRTIPRTPASLKAWTDLLTSIRSNAPPNTPQPMCLIQISHAGLQSSSTINFSRAPWSPALGPCSARPDTGSSLLGWVCGRVIWPTRSRELTDPRDWLEIVDMFVGSAKLAEKAGWDGVQVHSAHGYLLAEFLSPLVSIESFFQ